MADTGLAAAVGGATGEAVRRGVAVGRVVAAGRGDAVGGGVAAVAGEVGEVGGVFAGAAGMQDIASTPRTSVATSRSGTSR
jgi:hypothetical protein